ncbi:MAG: prepilin-type N-terminal cleavage/methylation domain-containing protein [bacterium]|nr:prepilin-type N-terminal cleavage/methylation domain-containing protein [bacterium]
MRRAGFTLVELSISLAILTVITGLGFVALMSCSRSVAVSQAKGDVQRNVRDIMTGLSRELQIASRKADDSLSPPLNPLVISESPTEGSMMEVQFQVPIDGTGRNWSAPITYRYINEDLNSNNRLDSGEDVDEDGVLTRRIVRLQDRNDDGDSDDPGESSVIGAVNDLSSVQIVRNGDLLTLTVTASRLVANQRTHPVTATATHNIYLTN